MKAFIISLLIIPVLYNCKILGQHDEYKKESPFGQNASQLSDSIHILQLKAFISKKDYGGASLYLRRNKVSEKTHKSFIEFFILGAKGSLMSKDASKIRILSNHLNINDLDQVVVADLIDLLEKAEHSYFLYPKMAELNIEQAKPAIRSTFESWKKMTIDTTDQVIIAGNEWPVWMAAIALSKWREEEAVLFLLDICKRQNAIDRRETAKRLLPTIRNLKIKEVTDYIITEFILSENCYDLNDPGAVLWCEMDIAYKIDVIKEFNEFKESIPKEQLYSRQVIRDWFRTHPDWHFEEKDN